jgi:hypothetical protein
MKRNQFVERTTLNLAHQKIHLWTTGDDDFKPLNFCPSCGSRMKAYSTQLICPRCNATIRVQGADPNNLRMDPATAEDNVRRFIEMLSSQARFGLRGEKPLAVIAALKYLCESIQTGIGLLALIENETYLRAIRHRFIALANLYGRISNPENSWSVITGGDRFELQTAVKNSPDLDKSISSLTLEQICSLSMEFVRNLANYSGPMRSMPASDGG